MTPPNGIKELPNGVWVVENDSHYAKWIAEHGLQCDPHLFKWLRPILEDPEIKVVWDVGACAGDHTDFYLSLGKTVVAIEPNPLPFACLEHNCPEATCLNIAASDHDGILRFSQLENVGASRVSDSGMLVVEGRKLDDMGLPDPQMLKIDVEGFEVFALRGMVEMLKRAKPILFIEVNRGALEANGHTPEDITSLLRDYVGYRSLKYYPENGEWHWPQFDLICKP